MLRVVVLVGVIIICCELNASTTTILPRKLLLTNIIAIAVTVAVAVVVAIMM